MDSKSLTFEFNGDVLKDIKCNIEIEDDTHWNKILVTTLDNSILKFQDMKEGRVSISSKNLSGDAFKDIELLGVSIREYEMSWGDVAIVRCTMYPKEVFVTQSFEGIKRKRIATLNYYLNKSPMFAPRIVCYPDKHGNVKQRKGEVLTFETANSYLIKSDTLFSYLSQNGHFESDQYQILTTRIRSSKSIINTVLNDITPHVEDIMLLMSFLQDSKVHSVNWMIEYSNKMMWHYKSNNFKASDIDNHRYSELIERIYIKDFMALTLSKYHASSFRKEIKNSINSLSIRKGGHVELTFLSFFQAFESLVLSYKRSNGLEFILDKEVFDNLKKSLAKTIKEELPLLKDQRGKIKNKLNELNRLSLKESTQIFLADFDVEIEDAWPLFDSKAHGITGLSTIRNVLIHGDLLPPEQLINIAIAMEHLRIILSRCIFCILGWDVSKTNISEGFLLRNHNLFNPEVRQASITEVNNFFISKNN